MAKKAKELTALEISRLTTPGHYAVGGVAGLYLYVNPTGARSWVMRVVVGDKRRHKGLGGFPDVTLAQARDKARSVREAVSRGLDPIHEQREALSKLRAQQASELTFRQATIGYLEAHGDTWKNAKHRAQWVSSLETYAYPVIGRLLVAHVELSHVLEVLTDIWKTKNETASRVRGRIESVLDWASARNYRSGDNPARWKGLLDKLLPAPNKIKKVEHHKALPIDDMHNFMLDLRCRSGVAALALEFTILCAARSGEVRGATWSEIDLDAKIWTIPAGRMKAAKEHRVPLVEQALDVLMEAGVGSPGDHIFVSNKGGMISDMAMTSVLRRMNVDAVPHGFRSTFRDWVGERTNYPRELAEQALAHTLGNKVEAAYRRGDALEKRREMMRDWADFCDRG